MTDDATEDPRWGKVGKQKIEDAGTLYPKRMETVDDEILDLLSSSWTRPRPTTSRSSSGSIRRACTSSLIFRRSTKRCATPRMAGRSMKPAWRSSTTTSASVMKKLKDMGVDDNTIVVFTTDNGTETFTWPDGGQTPFATEKERSSKAASACPASIRWPGKVPAGKVENGIISRRGLVSDLRGCGRQPEHH